MTFGEPGIEPTTSRFQVRGPTHWGILASLNCSSGGFLCIKNTKSVCQISRMRTCAWFFPCQNSARPSFSAAKIARPRFFRGQNSPPKVFPRPKEGGGEGGMPGTSARSPSITLVSSPGLNFSGIVGGEGGGVSGPSAGCVSQE